MVCHSGRFFTPAQFAVYVTKVDKVGPARGEPVPMVYGWSGQILTPDGTRWRLVQEDARIDRQHHAWI